MPGVNPPASMESDVASRPTLEDDGGRRAAAAATEGLARFVGIRDTEDSASPHSGQKRADSGTPKPQPGHGVKVSGFYAPGPVEKLP